MIEGCAISADVFVNTLICGSDRLHATLGANKPAANRLCSNFGICRHSPLDRIFKRPFLWPELYRSTGRAVNYLLPWQSTCHERCPSFLKKIKLVAINQVSKRGGFARDNAKQPQDHSWQQRSALFLRVLDPVCHDFGSHGKRR